MAWWPDLRERLRPRSRFARNVWQVASASVLAQALPLLAAPLLTRLYTPADFGALALFAAVLSLGLAVATGRVEWSVPNARSAGMAACLLVLGAALLLLATAAVGAVLSAGSSWLPGAWRALGPVGWLLPLALLGAGAQQLLVAWHVRSGELAASGRARVAQSVANVAVSLAAAPLLSGLQGLWGLAAGVVAGGWWGLRTLWRGAAGLGAVLRRVTRRRLAVAARRFRAEAGWSTVVSVANTASFAIVPLLLARHHSTAEVGLYALMQRVALGPVGVIGAAVSQSFWAEAARLVHSDKPALRRLYLVNTRRLAWLALPLALLALAGPWYVGPLFGAAQWAAAGAVLAASVPMLVGQVVVSPLSHLVVHRRQHWQALWDAARIVALAVAIEWAGRAGLGLVASVLVLSCVMAAMYVVLVALNLRALRAG